MTRITDLDEVFFPVEERDVFYAHSKKDIAKINNYKAIVNKSNDGLISIVSKDYQLVTNHQALEIGKNFFKQFFNTINTDDMEIFKITMPYTKSFCHIDVIHKNYSLNFFKKEVWLPYIRITNSYNRTKALCFDFGFCRKICKNGLIFEKETIKFKYYHSTRQIKPTFNFNGLGEKLKTMEEYFSNYINVLMNYHFNYSYSLPMVIKVFNLNNNNANNVNNKKEPLNELREYIEKLARRYFIELGDSGYAMLNVLSDFASNPPKLPLTVLKAPHLKIDTFQKKVSFWIVDFCNQIKRNVSIEHYLKDAKI